MAASNEDDPRDEGIDDEGGSIEPANPSGSDAYADGDGVIADVGVNGAALNGNGFDVGSVRAVSIDTEMRTAYLDYAMSVIVARALPDAA